jgi:hypothetical protein
MALLVGSFCPLTLMVTDFWAAIVCVDEVEPGPLVSLITLHMRYISLRTAVP